MSIRKRYKWMTIVLMAATSLFISSVIFFLIHPCEFFALTIAILLWVALAVGYIHECLEERFTKKLTPYLKPPNERTLDDHFKINEEVSKIFSIFHRKQKGTKNKVQEKLEKIKAIAERKRKEKEADDGK